MSSQQEPGAGARLDPCRHMARWVSALADGSLRGLPRLYTRLHVAGCERCRAALQAIRELRERLQQLGREGGADQAAVLTRERRADLEAALDAIDRRDRPPGSPGPS